MIPCSLFLPGKGQKVLFYGPGFGMGAGTLNRSDDGLVWYDDYNWDYSGSTVRRFDEVTHWEKFPEKPTEEIPENPLKEGTVSYFPILVLYTETKEKEVCETPDDIRDNMPFKVLQTNCDMKEKKNV